MGVLGGGQIGGNGPGGQGGPVALGGDLSGYTNLATVSSVDGQLVTAASKTIWVDPSGSATDPGTLSTSPTTLAHALATILSGGKIVMLAGDYPAATIGITCTIVGDSQASSAAVPATRITGLVTVEAVDVRIVGVDLAGGLSENSGPTGPGKTTLENCTISSIALDAPSTTTLELVSCTCGAINVTGANAGATIKVKSSTIGVLTHATTGSTEVELYNSTATQIVCSGGGALYTITSDVNLTASPSINVSSGTAERVLLHNTMCGDNGTLTGFGTLILTGAPASTVRIHQTQYDAASSTIPSGAEVLVTSGKAIAVSRFTALTTSNAPANAIPYLRLPVSGSINLDPWTLYESSSSVTVTVGGNNAAFWIDLFVNGVPSFIGALEAPLGVAGAQDSRVVVIVLPGAAVGGVFSGELRFAKSNITSAVGSVSLKSAALSIRAL